MTGKREKPVARDCAMIAAAVSATSTLTIRTRGVMTSEASCSAKRSVRRSSCASDLSSKPARAECRIRYDSSSALRAPESSSLGSMPIARMIAFAVLLNSRISGLNTAVKARWNGVTSFAVASGTARAKFFGTSSPMIIEKSVASTMPTTVPMGETAPSGRPRPSNGSRSRLLMAGSNV